MIKKLLFLLMPVFFIVTSCSKDDDPVPGPNEQTVFMYLPWSGNLTDAFRRNITDFETSIKQTGLNGQRVLVFFSTTAKEATLFELQYKKGNIERITLKEYTNPPFTTAEGITSILNDVKSFAPATRYAMTIGCHGMGWVPASVNNARSGGMKYHFEFEGPGPKTRWFGANDQAYRTDITTLAEGIERAGIRMEYILFDDCYMSNIEAAYDLKNVTDYVIGCPTEIMAAGMPYEKIGPYLVGNVDYESICTEFFNFYNTYVYTYPNGTQEPYPYGTIGVIKCSELDNLAGIMKRINANYIFDNSKLNSIQPMDGYSPVIFFDFGDYASKLCPDTELLNELNRQLNLTVPYKKHTAQYYTSNGYRTIDIHTYSGITISDPSRRSTLVSLKTQTAWYKATH